MNKEENTGGELVPVASIPKKKKKKKKRGKGEKQSVFVHGILVEHPPGSITGTSKCEELGMHKSQYLKFIKQCTSRIRLEEHTGEITAYQEFDAAHVSAVGHELGLRVIVNFTQEIPTAEDGVLASPVKQMWWDVKQDLFNTVFTPDSGNYELGLFSRVVAVDLYVMRPTPDDTSNQQAYMGVDFLVPGVGEESSTEAKAVVSQQYLINPSFIAEWQMCGRYHVDDAFQSALARPYLSSEKQLLFQSAIRDPVTGGGKTRPSGSGGKKLIQFMTVIHLDQPISPASSAKYGFSDAQRYTSPGAPGSVIGNYALVDITGQLKKLNL